MEGPHHERPYSDNQGGGVGLVRWWVSFISRATWGHLLNITHTHVSDDTRPETRMAKAAPGHNSRFRAKSHRHIKQGCVIRALLSKERTEDRARFWIRKSRENAYVHMYCCNLDTACARDEYLDIKPPEQQCENEEITQTHIGHGYSQRRKATGS